FSSLVFVTREAGVKFFRFNAGLAAILIAIGFAFHPSSAEVSLTARVALAALGLAEAATVIYWATVGRSLASVRPAIVATAVASGIVAIIAQAIDAVAGDAIALQALTIASFLSSAALLGGACTAMILGHWYLVIPSLQVTHLQSIVKVHIASTLVRVVVVAAAVFLAIATWQPGLGPSFRYYITSV